MCSTLLLSLSFLAHVILCLFPSSPFLYAEYYHSCRCSSSVPPQGSIHFYRISCCVWIFDSKPNTEQNQRVEAGVSITLNSAASPVIKTVDPSEPNLPRQLTPKLCHQCLALITSSADICLACKRQMWEGRETEGSETSIFSN